MKEERCRSCVGRRDFLRATAQALGAAALLPHLASLAACGADAAGQRALDGGDAGPDCNGDGGSVCTVNANTLVLPLAEHPELQAVGGLLILSDSRYSDPICQNNELVVAQVSEGTFAAFSASCTHACCTVSADNGGFSCPCHGSQFTLDGQVSRGPARSALPSIPVCFDGCSVYVQLA